MFDGKGNGNPLQYYCLEDSRGREPWRNIVPGVKSESEVAQPCPTLSDPMDYGLPGSSVRGIFQARVLEWGAIAANHL